MLLYFFSISLKINLRGMLPNFRLSFNNFPSGSPHAKNNSTCLFCLVFYECSLSELSLFLIVSESCLGTDFLCFWLTQNWRNNKLVLTEAVRILLMWRRRTILLSWLRNPLEEFSVLFWLAWENSKSCTTNSLKIVINLYLPDWKIYLFFSTSCVLWKTASFLCNNSPPCYY